MRLHLRSAHLLWLLLSLLGVGSWPSRAEAAEGALAAPCAPATSLLRDIASGAGDSFIAEPVRAGATLYFTADDTVHGRELWRSDGTPAGTQLVKDIRVGGEGAAPTKLTAVQGGVFFLVTVPGAVELWRSDGTEAGTARVKVFPPQAEPNELAGVGSTLFIGVDDGSSGFELWKSDGTEAGTMRVRDIRPGPDSSMPGALTVFQEALFFRANDGTTGLELWRSDGTEAGTRRVKDLYSGPSNGDPSNLTVVGQSLFFTAVPAFGNAKLWRSDGTEAGTVLLGVFTPPFHAVPEELTAAGGLLFFRIDDNVNGVELWKTDGTMAGTRLVRDIQPGSNISSSMPQLLTAVGDTLFFVANDGVNGIELWRSDGTLAGTRRVRDILSRPGRPTFSVLAPGPGVLLLGMNDSVTGTELWRSDGTAAGTYLLEDLVPGGESLPRALTVLGANLVFVASTPGTGQELFALPLTTLDCTNPTLQCPGPQTVEATRFDGTPVFFPSATASDDSLTQLTVSYTRPSGDTFRVGTYPVTATTKDAAGNSAACTFNVTVQDTVPPLIRGCPTGAIVREATSPGGAFINYPVVVSDLTSVPTVEHSRPPGLFPRGTTDVLIRATDQASNESRCAFQVNVQDTVAPSLTCPKDRARIAWSGEDLILDYALEVEDVASTPRVITAYPPGSQLPLGETTVDVTARDDAGNEARCSFRVQLVDLLGPTITCPEPVQEVASREGRAVVRFPEAVAADNLGPPEVSYSHEPGGTFELGETVVTATARDLGGVTASCSFTVTVAEAPPVVEKSGCQAGASGMGLGWLLLALTPLLPRRRAGPGARRPAR
jgi:ELWxxDGT repeat protein